MRMKTTSSLLLRRVNNFRRFLLFQTVFIHKFFTRLTPRNFFCIFSKIVSSFLCLFKILIVFCYYFVFFYVIHLSKWPKRKTNEKIIKIKMVNWLKFRFEFCVHIVEIVRKKMYVKMFAAIVEFCVYEYTYIFLYLLFCSRCKRIFRF